MSVRKMSVTNAKASQFDIGPSHQHYRPNSNDRFHGVCEFHMIPATFYQYDVGWHTSCHEVELLAASVLLPAKLQLPLIPTWLSIQQNCTSEPLSYS
ncbi:hypothetical protein TNCV_2815631 [Trichonephila clavipes]|nr:hypothetical protein TNCV_2815631 [Trichonephila clavipes]